MKSANLKRGEAAAYAKHRKELGLPGTSREAVSKKLASGALDGAIRKNGTIDHAKADRLWAESTGPAKNLSGKSKLEQFAEAQESGPADSMPGGTLQEWTLRKTAAEARSKELDVLERELALVERSAVAAAWVTILGNVRASLLGLPTELAQKLADQSDPKFVRKTLSDKLDQVLASLPEQFELVTA